MTAGVTTWARGAPQPDGTPARACRCRVAGRRRRGRARATPTVVPGARALTFPTGRTRSRPAIVVIAAAYVDGLVPASPATPGPRRADGGRPRRGRLAVERRKGVERRARRVAAACAAAVVVPAHAGGDRPADRSRHRRPRHVDPTSRDRPHRRRACRRPSSRDARCVRQRPGSSSTSPTVRSLGPSGTCCRGPWATPPSRSPTGWTRSGSTRPASRCACRFAERERGAHLHPRGGRRVARGRARPRPAGAARQHAVALRQRRRAAGPGQRATTSPRTSLARSEVAASRRRLVEAGDEQRRRPPRSAACGAEQTAGRGLGRPGGVGQSPRFDGCRRRRARRRARCRGRGSHPLRTGRPSQSAHRATASPKRSGDLAEPCRLPVTVDVPSRRFPAPQEAAVFFVCSEALANVAKYAGATGVVDRGRAGRPTAGRPGRPTTAEAAQTWRAARACGGWSDRVEALGGRLSISSPVGAGTWIEAELPIATDAS